MASSAPLAWIIRMSSISARSMSLNPALFIQAELHMTCPRTLIQLLLEPAIVVRRLARMEQRAIGEAGRGCAADRPLR